MSEMEEYAGHTANEAKAPIEDESAATGEGETVSPPAYTPATTVVPQTETKETAAVSVHTFQPQQSWQAVLCRTAALPRLLRLDRMTVKITEKEK